MSFDFLDGTDINPYSVCAIFPIVDGASVCEAIIVHTDSDCAGVVEDRFRYRVGNTPLHKETEVHSNGDKAMASALKAAAWTPDIQPEPEVTSEDGYEEIDFTGKDGYTYKAPLFERADSEGRLTSGAWVGVEAGEYDRISKQQGGMA